MNVVTAGRIKHLRKGWAILPFIGARSHYWTEDTKTMLPAIGTGRVRFYKSACSLVGIANQKIPALYEGNWPRCKTCQSRHSKKAGITV